MGGGRGLHFFLNQRLDRLLVHLGFENPRFPSGDFRDYLGPLLYYVILLFNLMMTFWIGEVFLGVVGVLLYVPLTVFFIRYC